MYIVGSTRCLLHCQVLNCDRRLAPSHPDPFEPAVKRIRSLKSNFLWAIVYKEDRFKIQWAMNVLQRKTEEELAAQNFRLAEGSLGVTHVLRFKSWI